MSGSSHQGLEPVGDIAGRVVAALADLVVTSRRLEVGEHWCEEALRAHRYARQLFRVFNAGGQLGVVVACARCRGGRFLVALDRVRATGIDPEDLPLLDDRRGALCARCGTPGAEMHHWAPRALFDDADLWPIDPLCQRCHAEWHRVTRTNGAA